MANQKTSKRKVRRNREMPVNTLAIRFTIFSLLIVAFAIGLSLAVVHDNRSADEPYQSGVVFR
jgi:hypothetical protein